ncbi:DUF1803 domain-containing protein [Enterococcus alcedinis]|uniref:DUF1803 domain-containing protein n=1 Tax=Enterococcus alcedinis TaxID=1274384 RepID=A0A917N3I8_9ENTE|nr:DUF1803 domain-containing protein [Enterococcus alcedinis]MBP2101153.1 hypothetical protein [Enterococcus alcedinis]GGI64548.1 hypothetical protein GCM10011482_02020 [Enterococcus alcedinis]
MRVLVDERNPKLIKMLEGAFFQQLYLLLSTSSEAPTLRQIKASVDEPKVEKTLDYFIKEKIISRVNKRYFLTIPTIKDDDEDLLASIAQELIENLGNYSKEQQILYIEALYQRIGQHPPIEIAEEYPMLILNSIETDLLKVLSFEKERWAFNLPNYFQAQRMPTIKTEFEAMTALIGDVNPSYYLDQVFVLVEKMTEGQKVRESIFLKSLEICGILQRKENISLTVPVIGLKEEVNLNELPSAYKQLNPIQQKSLLLMVVESLNLVNQTVFVIKKEGNAS